MLRRKLQIFVSSTHGDLVDVRLAAMEAILAAGHIPAAMEQFPPGDQTALEKIEAWIRQSDAYLLILGGRYGSRLPRSKKSYVEHEYDYALKRGIPFCSLVATDSALQQRAVVTVASETSTPEYRAFRTKVQRYHCASWDNVDGIKSAVHQILPHWAAKDGLVGWIRRDQWQEPPSISTRPFRPIVAVDINDEHPHPVPFDIAHRDGQIHRGAQIEIYSSERAAHLILRRNEPQRRLEVLGGHVDWLEDSDRAETYAECGKREIREELALSKNLSMSRNELDEALDACLVEVATVFNSGLSSHHNNREHITIYRMTWPASWPDPTLPWWKWSTEVLCAYWMSDADLLSPHLTNDTANTALRMFVERLVAKQKTISTHRTT